MRSWPDSHDDGMAAAVAADAAADAAPVAGIHFFLIVNFFMLVSDLRARD